MRGYVVIQGRVDSASKLLFAVASWIGAWLNPEEGQMTGNEIFNKHGLVGFPTIRKARVTRKELRAMLTEMAFPILLAGCSYDLANRKVGAGIYEVWLKEYKYV